MSEIRVRIAPSPSGFLHIGTAKMALFNWLFARKTGGTFVLRLEDTDAERSDEEYVQAMCEGFQWLGIDWDEGPEFGGEAEKGDFGPYRQSQRKELHVAAAHKLLEEGKAYKCFLSKDELDAIREKMREEKSATAFRSPWRDASAEEVAAQGDASYVVRFKVPEGETTVPDLVQGDVKTNNNQTEDFVILKPNGDPIFHLAVVVDDATMKISHVVRGDDHLTNAARHVMIFNALGYPLPHFAHLPMVLDERGKKYSKREHGANVLDWRADGYLPEGLINYVALLGWTPEEENRELFTREELIEAFTIERWGKSAARFDMKKVQWLNGQHLRMLSPEALRDRIVPILKEAGCDTDSKDDGWLTTLAAITQEKLSTLNDIVAQADFFFKDVTDYDEKSVKKNLLKDKEGALQRLQAMADAFTSVDNWQHEGLHGIVADLVESTGEGFGKYANPLRLALTGKSAGPGMFELTELLGKDVVLERISKLIEWLQGQEA